MTKLYATKLYATNKEEMLLKVAREALNVARLTDENDKSENMSMTGMFAIANEWYEKKKAFIDLFGGKTSIEEEVEMPLDEDTIVEIMHSFIRKIDSGVFMYKREAYALQFVKPSAINRAVVVQFYNMLVHDFAIESLSGNIITENMTHSHVCRNLCHDMGIDKKKIIGMKISKFFIQVLKYIMTQEKTERTPELKKLEALEIDIISQEFSQVINKLKTAKRRQTVVLSVALEDFMSMSYGNNWDSCHRVGGLYGMGAIAYALSENVILAYVKNDNEEYMKNWRQVIYCNAENGFAIGSRQYPSANDNATKTARNLWQKTFNGKNYDTYTTDNFKFSKNPEGLGYYLNDHNDFAYIDIKEFPPYHEKIDGHVWSTWHIEHGKDELNVCDYEIICPDCGEKFSDREGNEIACEDCRGGDYYCEYCGENHHDDFVTYVDSEYGYVCNDCLRDHFTYCNDCNEYHRDENTTYIDGTGECVCENCLDNYSFCDDCHSWYSNDEMTSVNDHEKYICESCLNSGDYTYCADCGEYFSYDNMNEINHDYYCENCTEDNFTECEFCGKMHNTEDMEEDESGLVLCPDCA